METLTLIQKVLMEPKYQDSNIVTHIYRQLQETLKGKSTQEYGYVVEVDQNIKVLDNNVDSTGAILYEVEFKVQTLKPHKGQILEGIVVMVFENGIFVEVQNEVKVLVPPEKMGKYRYVVESDIFKHKKKTISKDDKVKVKLDLIKYERRVFNCIGALEV